MKRFFCILLPLAFMPAGCSYFSSRAPSESKAGRPVKMDPAQADAIVRNIEKDRRETEEWLREKPTSYLAAIARIDFGDNSTLTVGSAPGNDVRLSAPDIEPHHLKVTVDGDHFHIDVIDSKATFMIEGKVQRDATVDPSYIQVGRFNLRLSHQHFPAIIVFDPQSPRMKDYKGLKYFPVDLSYRYELPLIPNPRREKIIILSTQGNRRSAERIGRFDFYVGNTLCRLEATRLLEPGGGTEDIPVFFRDATSGKESYSVGRYVDAQKLGNGKYLLDFNLAYNPACAFSEFYNCPIPPKKNTLKVAIRAGEMDSHYH